MIGVTVHEGESDRRITLEGNRCTLGSWDRCSVPLRGSGIRRVHLLVRPVGRRFEAVNLGPKGSVRHKGGAFERGVLTAGDTLEVGPFRVVFLLLHRTETAGPVPGTPRPSAPRRESFGEALFRTLRGSPPWLLSLACHLLAFLVLLEWTPAPPPPGPEPTVELGLAAGAEGGPGLEAEASRALEGEGPPADEPSGVLEAIPVLQEARAVEEEPEKDEERPAVPGSGVIGLPGEGWALPDRVRLPWKIPRKGGSGEAPFDAGASFGEGEATGANREAAAEVLREVEGEDQDEAALRRMGEERIVVVPGTYDHPEDVLAYLRLRHRLATPEDLETLDLAPGTLLVVGCGNRMISAKAAERVRKFVEEGGFLCTTDWGVATVLALAFPGRLEVLPESTEEGILHKVPVVRVHLPDPSDPMVRGLREKGTELQWWLEERSNLFEPFPGAEARVLAEAPGVRTSRGRAPLAVTFRHGRGEVLHLAGHLFQREGNLAGAYGMHRIFMNFLLRRVLERPLGKSPPAAGGPPGGRR